MGRQKCDPTYTIWNAGVWRRRARAETTLHVLTRAVPGEWSSLRPTVSCIEHGQRCHGWAVCGINCSQHLRDSARWPLSFPRLGDKANLLAWNNEVRRTL